MATVTIKNDGASPVTILEYRGKIAEGTTETYILSHGMSVSLVTRKDIPLAIYGGEKNG